MQLQTTETPPEFDSPEVQKAIQTLLKGTKAERHLSWLFFALLALLIVVMPRHSQLMGMIGIISGGISGYLASLTVRRKQIRDAYHLLMKVEDVRVIPVFNKIARLQNGFYKDKFVERLAQLYPLFTSADVNLLSEGDLRDCASKLVHSVHQSYLKYEDGAERETMLAAIDARVHLLLLAGGEKEYREVEKLSEAKMWNAIQESVRDRVLAALPVWRERLDSGDTPKMLLRPSENPTPPGELLRPAIERNDEDENQLLRPKE